MQQFIQNLMSTLQAQGSSGTSSANSSDSDSSLTQAVCGPGGRDQRGGDLQTALEKLASSDSSDSSSQSDLQASFNQLVSALGGSPGSSQATLGNFLSNLASDLQPSGNFVSTRV